jgi:hypothetical protein
VRTLLAILLALALPAAASAQTPGPPGATTGAPANVTQTTATVTGTVDPNGADTTYHFEYGTSTSYGLSTADQVVSGDPVAVQASLSGLTSDTTYHVRLVATNAAGTTRGADRTLHTQPPPANPRPPGSSTGGARNVSPTGATLTGSVDPNTATATYRFEFGRSTSYGTTTAGRSAGSGDRSVSVSAAIGSLQANTRYHYRLVATNAAGTTRGRDRSFVTARNPTGVTIALDPARVTWSRPLAVTGRVNGAGAGGAPLALQAQAWPFSGPMTQIATRNAASNGTFRFPVAALFLTTRYRVVTRTQVVATSPVVTASSAVRVGARVQSLSRRRARILGTIWPAVSKGRVSLQRRTRSGRWVRVGRRSAQAFDAERSRYRFTLRRSRRTHTYRVVVVARDGGAHVPGTSREVRVRRSAPRGG